MASPFFYEGLAQEVRTELGLGVHLLQPPILTVVPTSACFKTAMIWLSVNRDVFM